MPTARECRWFDPVELGTHLQWNGGGEIPTVRGVALYLRENGNTITYHLRETTTYQLREGI